MGLTSKDTFIDGFPVPLSGGSSEIIYTFKSSLLAGDPSSGGFCLDSATQSSAAKLYLSTIDHDGVDWTNSIDFFCSSTSTDKGQVLLRSVAEPTKYLIFKFTSLATSSGYRTISLAPLGSSGLAPFTEDDLISIVFFRTGDKGDPGGGGLETFVSFASVNSTITTLIDSWSASTYRSAKYMVQISDGVNFETSDIMIMQDGTTVHMLAYGNVFNNGTQGSFDATLVSNVVSLTFTATVATNKLIKFVRTPFAV